MNKILSLAERRALKARAHPLKPTVMIGNDGLSANVLQEIDSTLKAHELIKIRVDAEDSDEREDMLGLICASTGASAIDHIGKILVIYRERPQSSRDNKGNSSAAPSGGGGGRNQRGDNARGGRRSGGQGQASSAQPGSGGQNSGGQRKPGGKKPAGAVWTKVRQAGPNKRRGARGGPSNNRGAGGNNGAQGGGNKSGNGDGSSGGDEV